METIPIKVRLGKLEKIMFMPSKVRQIFLNAENRALKIRF